MYQFITTERNNSRASEYETKSMLYLFGCRKDSKEMEVFIIDCFNDVTGSNANADKLWDVQSKGVKSLNPKKIGINLVTLFQNYISDISFAYYILFMPKLKEMYLYNEKLRVYGIRNFLIQYEEKIKQGLEEEYERRNGFRPKEDDIENFLDKVEFVIANEKNMEYVKKITSFKSSTVLEEKFYDIIFSEIQTKQTAIKNINIHQCQIDKANEVLKYKKYLWKKDIDALVINRIVGMDIFNYRSIPNIFIDEIKHLNAEERKDTLLECQSRIAKLLFNKNGRNGFWKFFEVLLSYKDEILQKQPREILKKIKKEKVIIPHVLNDMSVIYLISILKEGL